MNSEEEEQEISPTGRTTEASMRAGVMAATRFAIEGFVAYYRQREPDVQVWVTGGDADWIAVPDCRVEPDLVMVGMNESVEN
mgnify:FL=1